MARAEGALDVHVETNIRQVMQDLKEFDPKLATAIRRRLRQTGDQAIAEMKQILAEPSPGIVVGTTTAVTRRRMDGTIAAQRRVRMVAVQTQASTSGQSRGSREAAAAALRTRVSTGKTRQSVRLTGAGGPFPKAYNTRVWRHPVRFNPAVTTKDQVPWVSQGGRPYFGAVLIRHAAQMRKDLYEALDEALVAIARDRSTPTT